MLLVGLTGVPSSGKTTVTRLFKELGAETLDSDAIVRDLLDGRTPESRRIADKFGDRVLGARGKIDRARLREVALSEPGALEFLERELHPAVRLVLRSRIDALKKRRVVLVIEVPLLHETGMDLWMERIVVVTAPESARRRNAALRGAQWEDVKKFAERQWDQARKAKKADIVIRNNSTVRALAAQVKRAYQRLSQEEVRRFKK